jgi:hypothetical protein
MHLGENLTIALRWKLRGEGRWSKKERNVFFKIKYEQWEYCLLVVKRFWWFQRDTQALEEQIRSKQEAKNREKEIELEYGKLTLSKPYSQESLVRQREEQLKIVESLLAEKEKIKRQQLEETKIWNLGVAARYENLIVFMT